MADPLADLVAMRAQNPSPSAVPGDPLADLAAIRGIAPLATPATPAPLSVADQARVNRARIQSGNDFAPSAIPLPPAPEHGIPANLAIGAYKGAASTGTNIMKGTLGAATGDFGPFSDPNVSPEIESGITPQGGAQNVGYYGEKLAEMVAPSALANRTAGAIAAGSDLVAPSGRVLAELPAVTTRLGRAALTAGTEGISNAAVTGIQTGDPKSMAWAGALGAMMTGPMKYFSRSEKAAALIDGVLDPNVALPGRDAGAAIQTKLAAVQDAAKAQIGSQYDAVRQTVQSVAPNAQVFLGGQNIALAQKVLDQLEGGVRNVEGLGAIDDVNKARKILTDMIAEGESGQGVSVTDAIQRRTFLNDLARSPLFASTNTGKGALQQLSGAWHDQLVSTLNAAQPGLGQQFSAASAEYGNFLTKFNQKTIQTLVKRGAPESILNVLLSPGAGESTALNLQSLIPKADMEVVRASLWKKVFSSASPSSSGEFAAANGNAILDALSPEAQTAIFGSRARVVKAQEFMKLMDTTWKLAAQRAAARGATGALVGTFVGRELNQQHVLDSDGGTGHFYIWPIAGAAMAITPATFARLMGKPGAMDILSRAMITPATSPAGVHLGAKIVALMGGQFKAYLDQRSEKAASEPLQVLNLPTGPAQSQLAPPPKPISPTSPISSPMR